MRFECPRQNGLTKWYEIDIMPLPGDSYAVVYTNGLRDPQGTDSILQPLKSIFVGDYFAATRVLEEKTANRLEIGYKKIEAKLEQVT